ncbi:MAG TPA: NAD(+) diphosphatase [Anaerolineae bacterium]|nr:NAD(+) diphosphatase [Anaerolineae bacterium]HMR64693.1 NAD(+) diphosphatase [Anaerolineae bacterium]
MNQPFVYTLNPPLERNEPAYWFAFAGDKLLYSPDGPAPVPFLVDFSELALTSVRPHYLGRYNGTPCYAVELPDQASPPAGHKLAGLRPLYPRLGDDFFVLAGRAIQIIDWDRTHQFCGRCGTPTVDATTERAKRCPNCGLSNYPRLSPSMIVRITRGDEILLARATRFPQGMYSVLAGFVEPGETLEQAVEREVFEEVGIWLKNIRYFGSQPWPFPNSLMIGFTAEYAGGELQPDLAEIEDACWFTAANLPQIPPPMSIARRLIDDFILATS